MGIYVNCPGGQVYAGLAIYDTMQFIEPDVQTICCGIAMSMGAIILAGGATGKRAILPNGHVLIHQPTGGFQGQSADVEIHAREVLALRDRLEQILAGHTGQERERVHTDMERDNFMTPADAVSYRIVDRILQNRAGNGSRQAQASSDTWKRRSRLSWPPWTAPCASA